jgi:hypothetical protein
MKPKQKLMVDLIQRINARKAPDMEDMLQEFYSSFDGEGEVQTAIQDILGDSLWKPILIGSRLKLGYDLEQRLQQRLTIH